MNNDRKVPRKSREQDSRKKQNRMPVPPPAFFRGLFFWVILLAIVFYLLQASSFMEERRRVEQLPYTVFLDYAEQGEVTGRVKLQQGILSGELADGRRFRSHTPSDTPELVPTLRSHGVPLEVLPDPASSVWVRVLAGFLPILLLIGFFWFVFYRRMGGGGGAGGGDQIMSFGRIKPQPLSESRPKTTFADVAGYGEAKEELMDVVDFLKDRQKFQNLGGRIPKGVLLIGPPGTGKTLLAKAVAGEANVSFLSISGSEFVEMFVGVGASRVRDLFRQAKKSAPSIIFVDEIDAVGRQRFAGVGGGHDEREQTLNQLLVEMDGFNTEEGIILMAATNRPDVLDPALVRPGRFDRQVSLDYPDIRERGDILRVHTRNTRLGDSVDLSVIARSTPGMSGADLANLCNEAALLASRKNHDAVMMSDLEEAMDRVMMGSQRRSLVLSAEEKKVIAYHEAGHAIVQRSLPESQVIHKVTIVPRGRSLGATHILPEKDIHIESDRYFRNSLITLLSGRAAEKIVFDRVYTGAENDLYNATELVRRMVCEWGMSENMGPVNYHNRTMGEIFLGRDLSQGRRYSEDTAREIDCEIKSILEDAERKADEILREKRPVLEKMADTLLEKETLTGREIDALINGGETSSDAPGEEAPGEKEPEAGNGQRED